MQNKAIRIFERLTTIQEYTETEIRQAERLRDYLHDASMNQDLLTFIEKTLANYRAVKIQEEMNNQLDEEYEERKAILLYV